MLLLILQNHFKYETTDADLAVLREHVDMQKTRRDNAIRSIVPSRPAVSQTK